jgi:hypothetical protein
MIQLQRSTEILLQPEFQSRIPADIREVLNQAVLSGVFSVFFMASLSSLFCLLCCVALEKKAKDSGEIV